MKNISAAVFLLCCSLVYADTQVSWKDLQANMDS